jgi:hypothetical protein
MFDAEAQRAGQTHEGLHVRHVHIHVQHLVTLSTWLDIRKPNSIHQKAAKNGASMVVTQWLHDSMMLKW